ncbi:MAG: CRISPR-associated protein Cas4 [Methanomicrobia archaeon]|nr:CRISPR-associated protein Cas4 [Methanomicrobia archaeon]
MESESDIGALLSKEMFFSGTQVNYYVICKTKLWLFSHFVTMEQSSDLVSYGKLVHETSYGGDKKKEIVIDDRIAIDFIRKGDTLVLHEVKKGKRLERAHRYQLLYYLFYLAELKGMEDVEGEIDYPLLRKKEKVELTDALKEEIKTILKGIQEVVALPEPPRPSYLRICRKCAYFEFCWV